MAYRSTASTSSSAEIYSDAAPTLGTSRAEHEAAQSQLLRSRMKQSLKNFYDRNFGLFLVFLAQSCGSVMSTAAKLLETGYETKCHALQIIFVRMLCTTILGSLYMWYNKVSDFPFGQHGIRKLLVLRGAAGFVGLFGLYYSLSWLDFADATVITFIIPTMTAFVCFVWLREPFTWREALAGFIAFSGVLFVARPPWLFPDPPHSPITGKPMPDNSLLAHALDFLSSNASTRRAPTDPVYPRQRTIAILFAVLGTFGASTAYATIRVIGKRSHSLISVNYFAAIATLGSTLVILIHPNLHFVMPESLGQWGLIAIIGLTGFLLQFLLTEGLQREKAGRATNLTYLQLVFALIIERVVWGTTPPMESLFGAVLIIGAALWVSLQKNGAVMERKLEVVDEESSLLGRSERDA